MLFPDRYFQGLDAPEAANKDQVKKERNTCLSNIILSNYGTYKTMKLIGIKKIQNKE